MEFEERPAIRLATIEDLQKAEEAEENANLDFEEDIEELTLSSLASYIISEFQINRDAKRNSGVEEELITSLRQYIGEYSTKEKQLIRQNNSVEIFIKLTAVKSRTLASWIKDILLNPKARPWSIEPTPSPQIRKDIREQIEQKLSEEFDQISAKISGTEEIQTTISQFNRDRREIIRSVTNEVMKEAKFNMSLIEEDIEDKLVEGGFYTTLSDFIDDFCIYPTAFLKGPIITKKKSLQWEQGKPSVTESFIFKDRRVSPFDIYPAPEATSLMDGSLIEHLRLTHTELHKLAQLDPKAGYKREEIYELLEKGPSGAIYWLDSGIESDKAELEDRGTSVEANKNIYHGLHFFGSVPAHILVDWGFTEEEVLLAESGTPFEVEAVLVENKVIKCILNQDPLLRRPYYCASFQNTPGSIWGKSLPYIMRDHQKLCNATARSLVVNLGIASGPQVEVYTDRLADSGEITSIYPLKIWQVSSDPTSGGGRAVQFFQPTMIANDLLAIFSQFEERADDATGIPRYQYGNEAVKGAGLTAAGLAMLFESSSKSVKNAIRNIDLGVLVPRIEYQFYWTLLSNQINYTGDIHVKALGADTLSVKGTQELRRNEFLQITANQFDQELMGRYSRATLLSEIAKDLGLEEPVVPSYLELKQREKREQEMAAKEQEMKQKELENAYQMRIAPANIQIKGQQDMQAQRLQFEMWREQVRQKQKEIDQQLKNKEIESINKQFAYKVQADTMKNLTTNKTKEEIALREMALKLKTGSGI